jgi:hypothetical protein
VLWQERDVNATGSLLLNRWGGAKLRIADASTFLSGHPRFVVYGDGPRNGSLSRLLDKGANLQLRAIFEDELLMEVSTH